MATITEIRGYHVECALPEAVRNAVGTFEKRGALVVEVIAENGMSGWGECTHHPAATWAYLETALAPRLRGQDPSLAGSLWRAMIGPRPGGDIQMMAISAVDMALWDLRGRIEGKSISTLLGGRLREHVRTYASGPFMKLGERPYRDFPRDVEAYVQAGFQAVKARCGIGPREDAEMVAELRAQLGPDVLLMVDVNRGYSRPAASELVHRLAEANLLWIEEPIAPDDLDGYRELSRHAPMPIAAGEALASLGQFRSFLAAGVLGIVQPDLYLCGGFTGATKIAALAEAFDTPYVPHVWGTAINFYASLQLAAVLPPHRLKDGAELPMFEWDRSDNALLRVAGEPAIGPGGTVAIPDAPGIGIDIDRDIFAPFVKRAWQISF